MTQPLDQGNATVPPLLNSSQEMTQEVEHGMVTAREAQDWMAGEGMEAALFMERLALAYGRTSSFLSRLMDMAETWDGIPDMQERLIPSLRILKSTPREELVDKRVIAAGAAYDFHHWFWAVTIREEVLEKARIDGLGIEEQVRKIQEKICMITTDVFDREVIRENDMQLERLKHKVQETFFSTAGPFLKQDFARVARLSSIRKDFEKQEADWEGTFARCAEKLDGLEFRISMLPPVTMDEVIAVVSRFAKHNATQMDRDASP